MKKGKKIKKLPVIIGVLLVLFIIGLLGSGNESTDIEPTKIPTQAVTEAPTTTPKVEPTATPTQEPTKAPTVTPTVAPTQKPTEEPTKSPTPINKLNVSEIPEYSGEAYISIFDNIPSFSDADFSENSFETYSSLDALGRCGVAYANIGPDLMPDGERGSIGQVKPAGWHTVKYDNIEGLYLYNRCHLIGWQLTGENANEMNLITGTRYMNVQGMLPLEDMVADYVKETGNHVLYRVTPIYNGNNLISEGLQIEAMSIEDRGQGICFNVFCYNVQPGIVIDYATGESFQEEKEVVEEPSGTTYIMNTNTKKFHVPSCSSAADIKEKNRAEFTGDRQELIDDGYSPCKRCNP